MRKQTEGEQWLEAMVEALREEFNPNADRIYTKKRRTQKHEQGPRYKKLGSQNDYQTVCEGDLKFLVNLGDYLDTGLFADHRITRQMFGKLAEAKIGFKFIRLYR